MTIEKNIDQPLNKAIPLDKQFELKEYLNRFFDGFYETKLRIQTHLEVSKASQTNLLQNQRFWHFFQNNTNVSLVVARMFSLFDENHKHILKRFIRFLRSQKIYNLTDLDIANWFKVLEPYESFRNGIIAHTALNLPFVPEIAYEKFLDLLNQFENKLTTIRVMYITESSVINGTWSDPSLYLECEILSDLRIILSK